MIWLLLTACLAPPSDGSLPLGDAAVFADRAQPALAAGCATGSCHGTPERPLEIFAVQRHRLDPEQVWLDVPLTEQELELNRVSAAWFVLGAEHPDDSELLRKPLAPGSGGTEHTGGVQYGDGTHPEYTAIATWIETVLEAP